MNVCEESKKVISPNSIDNMDSSKVVAANRHQTVRVAQRTCQAKESQLGIER